MTVRAVGLGLLMAVVIAALGYYNQRFFDRPMMGTLFPPAAMVGLLVLLLVVNPLVGLVRRLQPLGAAELTMIAALALAACHFPGSLFGTLTYSVATPGHWHQGHTGWRAHRIMSYVPGGSPRLGEGHVRDYVALSRTLVPEASQATRSAAVEAIWDRLPPHGQQAAQAAAAQGRMERDARRTLLSGFDQLIVHGRLFEDEAVIPLEPAGRGSDLLSRQRAGEVLSDADAAWLNRWLVTWALPEYVLPPPAGRGVLLAGEGSAPVVDTLLQGADRPEPLWAAPWQLQTVPWADWWPVLRLWGSLGLLTVAISLCLALVVHPQWSRRELLAYPVASFVEQVVRPQRGCLLPGLVYDRLFWAGLVGMLVVYAGHELANWFPAASAVKIPLAYDFTPLQQLFPNAAAVPGSERLFAPTLYPIIFAFAFFISRQVGFTFGISGFVYLFFGALMLGAGMPVQLNYYGAEPLNMLLFGAYAGAAFMVLYIGRRYYLHVAGRALGLSARRGNEIPGYAVWAARTLLIAAVAMMFVLTREAGLDWPLSLLLLVLTMLFIVMVTRINAETGALFIQPYWFPFSVLTGLLGIEAIGPTGYILMALACSVLIESTHLLAMPLLANALRMTDRQRGMTPARVVPWLVMALLGSFVVAGVLTLYIQHQTGLLGGHEWVVRLRPAIPFHEMTRQVAELSSLGTLSEATAATGIWERLALIRVDGASLSWAALGMVLCLVCAAARLKLPWWPIHPVLFLVVGTYPSQIYSVSFLLGWMAKVSVIYLGGAVAHERAKHLMIGVVAATLVYPAVGLAIDATYFMATGLRP